MFKLMLLINMVKFHAIWLDQWFLILCVNQNHLQGSLTIAHRLV